MTRVKAARTAILPRLLDPAATAAQKATLRNDLRGAFFAQQFHFLHPPEYLDAGPFGEPPPERVLETLARFDEDLNDAAECVGRWRVHLRFGEALPVGPVRPRGVADPLIATIRTRLRDLLEETAAEVRPEDPPADGHVPRPARRGRLRPGPPRAGRQSIGGRGRRGRRLRSRRRSRPPHPPTPHAAAVAARQAARNCGTSSRSPVVWTFTCPHPSVAVGRPRADSQFASNPPFPTM